MARHKDFALGMMYFLQNDTAVPEDERRKAREWGLAKDEFTDNDNFPYEMYIREARRIVGRYVFTEHDASLARGYTRTPIHEDSIAIAEWFMDSHEVSTELKPGSTFEGKVILSELTRPSQIPYRALLPKNLDNLLVPGALISKPCRLGHDTAGADLDAHWRSGRLRCRSRTQNRDAPGADLAVPSYSGNSSRTG